MHIKFTAAETDTTYEFDMTVGVDEDDDIEITFVGEDSNDGAGAYDVGFTMSAETAAFLILALETALKFREGY